MPPPASSLGRMLALLDAFNEQRPAWDVEALSQRFGYPTSSTYRYVRELCRAGLLVRLPPGIYVIGARVVELEALIRHSDPLTTAGQPLLQALAQETGCHALLSNLYGDRLLNVIHAPGLEPLQLAYLRGRSLPWFRGAPSKSVLAFRSKARVRKLYDEVFGAQATDEQWHAIWAELRAVRKAGYCVSQAELEAGVVGFGAPVLVEGEVMGSLSLVCSAHRASLLNPDALGARLQDGARSLAEHIEHRASVA